MSKFMDWIATDTKKTDVSEDAFVEAFKKSKWLTVVDKAGNVCINGWSAPEICWVRDYKSDIVEYELQNEWLVARQKTKFKKREVEIACNTGLVPEPYDRKNGKDPQTLSDHALELREYNLLRTIGLPEHQGRETVRVYRKHQFLVELAEEAEKERPSKLFNYYFCVVDDYGHKISCCSYGYEKDALKAIATNPEYKNGHVEKFITDITHAQFSRDMSRNEW